MKVNRALILAGAACLVACSAQTDTADSSVSRTKETTGDSAGVRSNTQLLSGAKSSFGSTTASRQATRPATDVTVCKSGARAPWLVRMSNQSQSDPADQFVRVTYPGSPRPVCVNDYWGGVTNTTFSIEGGPHVFDLGATHDYAPSAQRVDPKKTSRGQPDTVKFASVP